jgi:hypothetical protein
MESMSMASGSSASKIVERGSPNQTTRRRPASRRRVLPAALALLVAVLGMGFGASPAFAGVSLGTSPDIPNPNGSVTVGQTNLASELTISNSSTASQATQSITLSNITLVPSCGVIASIDCPAASFDPDVFALSASGTGVAGTACAGTTFTITNIDQTQDKYLFTPSSTVVLGPAATGGLAARCVIDFTIDVLRVPTHDSRPEAGVQTNELGGATGTATDTQVGQGTGSNFTTVNRAQPAIATTASPDIVLGAGTLADSATVTGRTNPGGGTVTFSLYGPDDGNCSGAVIYTVTVEYPPAGGTVSSGPFTPTAAGTYRWVAAYSGDANNLPVTGLCNAANESTSVTAPGTPPPPVAPPPPPPPGVTPPPPPPPAAAALPETCTPPPGPAPAGGELCAPGTARISGATGCQGTTFRINVTGRQIKSVVFTRDGKKIKTLTKANRGSAFSISVNPRALKFGAHRVVARTTFTAKSGTKARTLRVVFSRCARAAVSPRFTG